MTPLVDVVDLRKSFARRGLRRLPLEAVAGVSFAIEPGESVGLVGASGSGKTTIAKIVCGLERPTSGQVSVAGFDLSEGNPPPRRFYRDVQMIFQDPYLSLSPRMTIRRAVGYALSVQRVPRAEIEQRVRAAMSRVGLPTGVLDRYPHQLSTGQRQRVGIARALIARPSLIVADEPVSSVDVSLQTQILNLLADIQRDTGVAFLFISHDLAVVGYLCERVLVMQNGQVIEQGTSDEVLTRPQTEYTRLLVEAAGIGDSIVARTRSAAAT
jgi:peptide/nickel transport system ATP-binding protein